METNIFVPLALLNWFPNNVVSVLLVEEIINDESSWDLWKGARLELSHE